MSLILRSSDKKEFTVELAVIVKSRTISNMIRDLGLEDMNTLIPIPLPNVDSKILEKVLEWCRQHKDDAPYEAPKDKQDTIIPEWDTLFLTIKNETLMHIIMAANYLDIPALLDYSCQMVAEKLKNKSPEQIQKEFQLKNDFTEEELAEIKTQSEWCAE